MSEQYFKGVIKNILQPSVNIYYQERGKIKFDFDSITTLIFPSFSLIIKID